ncbi:hypothetical protein [Herbidospora yilanensis]|uniref:hypothetical protein n=1 Tax=Herbidospora yilanensis TaxID=354426 RepID=UPI0007856723|nr:hypothetical protein [Herbidospora yilanensis]
MIEAARTRAGECRADDFLRRLEESRQPKDAARLADVLIRMERYAVTGSLAVPRELNNLRDGIREIKAGDVRLPFFEVPGSAADAVRLTSGFIKQSWRAPRKYIDEAIWVRTEDLAS